MLRANRLEYAGEAKMGMADSSVAMKLKILPTSSLCTSLDSMDRSEMMAKLFMAPGEMYTKY